MSSARRPAADSSRSEPYSAASSTCVRAAVTRNATSSSASSSLSTISPAMSAPPHWVTQFPHGKLKRLARSLLPLRPGTERPHGGDVPVPHRRRPVADLWRPARAELLARVVLHARRLPRLPDRPVGGAGRHALLVGEVGAEHVEIGRAHV